MRPTRIRLVVVSLFVLALLGGVAAGVLAERLASPAPASPSVGSLDELQLNDSQRAQIRSIWEGVEQLSGDCYRQAQQLNQQREQKLTDLLNEQQRQRYGQITQEYNQGCAVLDNKRQAALKTAIEQTRHLLTVSQREKYDRILSQRLGTGIDGGSTPPIPLSPLSKPAQ